MFFIPNQSAIRIIVPRFPGSCNLSRIIVSPFEKSTESIVVSEIFTVAKTFCGVVNALIFLSSIY